MGLFRQKKKKEVIQKIRTERIDKLHLSYQFGNVQGIGARRRQEDSFAFVNVLDVVEIKNNGLMFVVADGMGGMKDGKIASETAIASLKESFQYLDRSGNISEQLAEALYVASGKVEEILDGEGGSTAIICMIYKEFFYYASVGDSFLYLYRNGKIYQINEPHTVCVQKYKEELSAGGFDPYMARNDVETMALTQFLGMTGMDEVDYNKKPIPINNEDMFLVCSDGIGGVLEEEKLKEFFQWKIPQDICDEIENEIMQLGKGNQDNYTGIIVRCVY